MSRLERPEEISEMLNSFNKQVFCVASCRDSFNDNEEAQIDPIQSLRLLPIPSEVLQRWYL